MSTFSKVYTRRNGERFMMTVSVDLERIADDMAARFTRHGRPAATALNGAIAASVSPAD